MSKHLHKLVVSDASLGEASQISTSRNPSSADYMEETASPEAVEVAAVRTEISQTREQLHLKDKAVEAAVNGIIIADPTQKDCPVTYVNPAFTAITGYSSDEVIGKNCRFLQGPLTDPNSVEDMRQALREERQLQTVLKNYKKDGSEFWNELIISPVRDAKGVVTFFIGVQNDITERRNAEDSLMNTMAKQQTMLRDMLASVTGGKLSLCRSANDLPPQHPRFADPIELSRLSGIRELRRHAQEACRSVGIPENRCYDLDSAVGEAAMNAVVHASTGTGHVFAHSSGIVQVRVEDDGEGIPVEQLPNATLKRGYSSAGTFGHGFKMILETVDRVHLLTGSNGTTVILEQEKLGPLPRGFGSY